MKYTENVFEGVIFNSLYKKVYGLPSVKSFLGNNYGPSNLLSKYVILG